MSIRLSLPRFLVFLPGTILLAALYAPFFGNPLVFDDHGLFDNNAVYDYAQTPFLAYSRIFPYFTLGLMHVLSGGDLLWNRVFSLALHALVVIALYFFLRRATRRAESPAAPSIMAVVCLWVALNPAAVYGAAYLVQRTILFACLFSILAATLYLRAQQEARNADLFSAALMSLCAMLGKEHAVLLPAAVVALTPLVCNWNRATRIRAAGYLALALPCALWIALRRNADALLGTAYEIYAGEVSAQIGAVNFPGGEWAMSIATQLLLFWKYLFLWFVPNPQWMSVDLRIDFPSLWSGMPGFAALALSVLALLAAGICWLRGCLTANTLNPRLAFASALLFAAIPFAVELSVIRVQDPFVLYRSYLWMPAYALLLTLLLLTLFKALGKRPSPWPRRSVWVILILAAAGLFPLAQDRLQSFSSEVALWQDALQKLPRHDVPGADRIYYNLAGEAFKRKDFDEALRYSELVIKQNPTAFQGYLARGTSLLALRQLDAASAAFDEADRHNPPPKFLGYIESKRCAVLEIRNERDATIACLRRSAKMGYGGAAFRLKMMGLELH